MRPLPPPSFLLPPPPHPAFPVVLPPPHPEIVLGTAGVLCIAGALYYLAKAIKNKSAHSRLQEFTACVASLAANVKAAVRNNQALDPLQELSGCAAPSGDGGKVAFGKLVTRKVRVSRRPGTSKYGHVENREGWTGVDYSETQPMEDINEEAGSQLEGCLVVDRREEQSAQVAKEENNTRCSNQKTQVVNEEAENRRTERQRTGMEPPIHQSKPRFTWDDDDL